MIQVSYEATFSLDESLKPLNALYDMKDEEPKWYWQQRTNILHRMDSDLQDDIEKCDKRVDKVVIDYTNWVRVTFAAEDPNLIREEVEELKYKIQLCIDKMVAEYPARLKKYHDDLIADGEEIPVDVYQP